MDQERDKQYEYHRYAWVRAQRLLDGIILYQDDLGELGGQLESLLKRRGLRATTDVYHSLKLH